MTDILGGDESAYKRIVVSILKPTLKNVRRIAIARVELKKVQFETTPVANYKTADTLRFIINGPPFITNISLILRSPSEGPRYDWPENPQVSIPKVNGYDRSLLYDAEWAALNFQNGRKG